MSPTSSASTSGWTTSTSRLTGDSRLYALEVLLHHDTAEEPLEAGRVLLALPFPFPIQFVYSGRAYLDNLFDPECQARNSERLAGFLAHDGVRSDDLQAFPDDARAEVTKLFEPPPDPTEADQQQAIAAAAVLATALGERDLGAACRSIDPDARTRITYVAGTSCRNLVSPLADLLPRGSVDRLIVAEAQPGWIKVVGPADGGHQLVTVFQATIDPLGRRPKQLEWALTNLYDAAVGPLSLANS